MNAIIRRAPSLPAALAAPQGATLDALLESIRRNCSRATWHAIEMDTRAWRRWCAATGRSEAMPVAPAAVVAWIQHQERDGKGPGEPCAAATIRRRLATLAKLHKLARLPNPCADELVRLEVKGVGRRLGRKGQHQAPGLMQADADRIAVRVGERRQVPVRTARNLALMHCGRDLLARSGELVSIEVQDVTLQEDGAAIVQLCRFKTEDEKKPLHLGADAAASMRLWLAALASAGITSGPVFRIVNKSGAIGPRAIGARDVTRALKELATEACIDVAFTGHSVRVGMARDLAKQNFELPAIMQAGNWANSRMVAR